MRSIYYIIINEIYEYHYIQEIKYCCHKIIIISGECFELYNI